MADFRLLARAHGFMKLTEIVSFIFSTLLYRFELIHSRLILSLYFVDCHLSDNCHRLPDLIEKIRAELWWRPNQVR